MNTLTANEATASLKSNECPGCNGHKMRNRSVCTACWKRLPRTMQNPLYNLISRGYEKAITEAIEFLTKSESA